MTKPEEIKELKVGVSIKKLLWRVINAVFPYNEKEEGLSIKERSLLEDILLFKSFREIAALRGCTKTAISYQYNKLMEKIEKRILSLNQAANNENLIEPLEEQKRIVAAQTEEINKLKAELSRAKENEERLARIIERLETTKMMPYTFAPMTANAPTSSDPIYLSDYKGTLMKSDIELLNLREAISLILDDNGIKTVFDLVTIPKEVLLKKIPKFWAEAIQDKLRLHGLQLGMKIKYIPKMNKYLVEEK